jgi:hypothetical protein
MTFCCLLNARRALFRNFLAGTIFLLGLFPLQAGAEDRALIVSIDKYADSRLSGLPAGLAENDAASIQKLLTEKLGYKAENIKLLLNEQATKAAILSALEKWLGSPASGKSAQKQKRLIGLDESGALDKKKKKKRKTRKKKNVKPPKSYRSYFYFSGLGHFHADSNGDELDGLDETLIPYDARVNPVGGKDEIDGMILDDEIAELLGKFSRRHMTLVLDTSHAGLVTRSSNLAGKEFSRTRVPHIKGAVRSIKSSAMKDHKGEGAFVDVKIPRGSLNIWSGASPTQTALIAGEDDAPQGLFTLLYVEGFYDGKADINANNILSSAELLRHVSEGSAAYCAAFKERCEMGLRPRLDPPSAYGRAAWVDRKKITRARQKRLTLSRLSDFLGKEKEDNIEIKQIPSSPLHVGAGDIRYEVLSPSSGYLILLNLTSKGKLFQLYPNQYSGSGKEGFAGLLQANTPLVVPEESYGVTFSATEPAKGHIIAIVTPDPVKFDISVTQRTIASVSPKEAMGVYLAGLSAALNHPLNMDKMQSNTGTARWSVKTLPYEILP